LKKQHKKDHNLITGYMADWLSPKVSDLLAQEQNCITQPKHIQG